MNHPAYRISVNKSVDRCLFIDLIHFAEKLQLVNMNDAEYYSLGGPFLIDLKLIHSIYPFLQLNSIEEDENTYLRQKKHRFCKNLKLNNKSATDFISENDFEKQTIFWLDYTKLSKPYLDDMANLILKLPAGSIVKITFNSSPPYKPTYEKKDEALLKFKDKFSVYLPAGKLQFSNISESDQFEPLVYDMVKNAVNSLLRERKEFLCFEFCDAVIYADTCPMMSLSGILLKRTDRNRLVEALEQQTCFSPNKIREINMPDLSVIERHLLNQKMPTNDIDELLDTLGYPLVYGEKEPWSESRQKLLQYSHYWHRYPDFVKITL